MSKYIGDVNHKSNKFDLWTMKLMTALVCMFFSSILVALTKMYQMLRDENKRQQVS